MRLIIDIPEEVKLRTRFCCSAGVVPPLECYAIIDAFLKGTPLPKGHGRLIDEKEVKKMIEEAKVNSEHSKTFAENIIKFAPAIIEADKESTDETDNRDS